MNYRTIKRVTEAAAAIVFLFFVLLLPFSSRQDLFSGRQVEDFSSGWTYQYENESGKGDLPIRLDVPADTLAEFSHTVPEETGEGSGIVFRTRMQYVRVYVGESLIYQFPEEELIGGRPTSAWNFVRLNQSDAGKELRICVWSPYERFSGGIGAPSFGDFDDLVTAIIAEQGKILRISILIGVVGAAIILISLGGSRYPVYRWHRHLGILLVFTSFWLCGESAMPSGIVGLEVWHYFSLVSLLFCPVFLASYLYARWPEYCRKGAPALFWVSLASALFCLCSEFLGGPDLIEMLPLTLTLTGTALGYTVFIYFHAAKRKKGVFIRSELVCVLIIALFGLTDVMSFIRSTNTIGFFLRFAILLYALNLLRICVTMLYRKIRENQELQQRLRRSRAELMASQIKPHFIYNTLNSIRALIQIDPETARKTVYDFSTYLRSNLGNMGEREQILFSEELNHIRAYLNIEKVRFEERLNIVMDIRTVSFLVPPLSIQPLVENAVKHGVCAKVEGGTVAIHSYKEDDEYVVCIEDDGNGFDPSCLDQKDDGNGSHIGLENIRFRVGEISGGSLSIQDRPGGGTRVTVVFPENHEHTEGR